MSEVSQKLTLSQISKDIHAVSIQCDDRADDDARFREEVRRTDSTMQETLEKILTKLDPDHKDYINRGIENKLDPDHDDYILRETNAKVDILMELYNGVGFSVRALKYVSGALLSLSLLIGVLFAFIKFAAK